MLPCSTYVLDHTLSVTPDALFDTVQQFVENLPSGSPQPLGVYGDVHFTLAGVEWGADHTTIDILARLSVPCQEDHWRLHEADAYELVHAPTIRWDDLSSMTLVSVEVIPSTAEALTARIMARPGTAAEQLAIRLAAHIVRETAVTSCRSHTEKAAAQEAAYEKWKHWLETRLEPLMSDKMDRKLGFSVGQSRVLLLNVGSDYFVTQLRELTDQVHVDRFITEKGYISLSPTHLTYHPRLDRSFVLYLWGRHHTVEDGAEAISHLGPAILLKVTPLTDKRIKVTTTCVFSAVERYYDWLLEQIKRQNPNTQEEGEPTKAELIASMDALSEAIVELTSQQPQTRPPIPGKNVDGKRRGKNIDTAIKVAKARLIMELRNRCQTEACSFASVAPATFRKWRDDPDVLSEMERLRQDGDFLKEI